MAPFSKRSTSSSDSLPSSTGLVVNFRPVLGLHRVYRCSAPDRLGERILEQRVGVDSDVILSSSWTSNFDDATLTDAERFILYDATLIIDLRRSIESESDNRKALLDGAPGGPFLYDDLNAPRQVLNVDVVGDSQGPRPSPGDNADSASIKDALIQEVNKRGMIVLFELMLRESKDAFKRVLQAVTQHLEERPDGKVLIHCTQGKDRTGLVSMLLQSAVGMSDDDILLDFAKSKENAMSEAALQAIRKLDVASKVDRSVLASADPQLIKDTLALLREQYGSILGYLDEIGFDASWRQRLVRMQQSSE